MTLFHGILQAASKETDEVVVTPSSSNATTPGGEIPNSDILGNPPGGGTGKRAEVEDIQLLQLRLQEAQCRNMVIEAEMEELKTRVRRHHT